VSFDYRSYHRAYMRAWRRLHPQPSAAKPAAERPQHWRSIAERIAQARRAAECRWTRQLSTVPARMTGSSEQARRSSPDQLGNGGAPDRTSDAILR
jgi:hypothetical protein